MDTTLYGWDMPRFAGTNSGQWLLQADEYFEANGTSFEDRLQLAFISMEGEADMWFYGLTISIPDLTWDRFNKELQLKFHGQKSLEAVSTIIDKDITEAYKNIIDSKDALSIAQREKQDGLKYKESNGGALKHASQEEPISDILSVVNEVKRHSRIFEVAPQRREKLQKDGVDTTKETAQYIDDMMDFRLKPESFGFKNPKNLCIQKSDDNIQSRDGEVAATELIWRYAGRKVVIQEDFVSVLISREVKEERRHEETRIKKPLLIGIEIVHNESLEWAGVSTPYMASLCRRPRNMNSVIEEIFGPIIIIWDVELSCLSVSFISIGIGGETDETMLGLGFYINCYSWMGLDLSGLAHNKLRSGCMLKVQNNFLEQEYLHLIWSREGKREGGQGHEIVRQQWSHRSATPAEDGCDSTNLKPALSGGESIDCDEKWEKLLGQVEIYELGSALLGPHRIIVSIGVIPVIYNELKCKPVGKPTNPFKLVDGWMKDILWDDDEAQYMGYLYLFWAKVNIGIARQFMAQLQS